MCAWCKHHILIRVALYVFLCGGLGCLFGIFLVFWGRPCIAMNFPLRTAFAASHRSNSLFLSFSIYLSYWLCCLSKTYWRKDVLAGTFSESGLPLYWCKNLSPWITFFDAQIYDLSIPHVQSSPSSLQPRFPKCLEICYLALLVFSGHHSSTPCCMGIPLHCDIVQDGFSWWLCFL